jgi:protein-tyrosine phosphatase
VPAILFVCTGNQYRSPIAAAAFRRKAETCGESGRWTVLSAGTWTASGLPPFPEAVQVAAGLGLDLAGHSTCSIDQRDLAEFDAILVMERGHKEAILSEFPASRGRVHLLAAVADQIEYDIPDPAGPDADLGQVARQLLGLIERGFPSICSLAAPR